MEETKTDDMTTIQIKKSDADRMEQIKEHPRVANHEIVSRLIDFWICYKDVVKNDA